MVDGAMQNNAFEDIIGRLPVAPVLEEFEAALDRRRNVVMVAPPGAGKTTAVNWPGPRARSIPFSVAFPG